ncbi:unnamed protein product [Ceutorhynchus assimilis]|uniref:MMS19 nucleotide excision repair protein n=1 Tax=Ceutorhynchus assimilis TaxID=467358 RepID=A0A9N9QR49_9CUCU|nr:unnamed protein product [Ceutorhynchus assimilis]
MMEIDNNLMYLDEKFLENVSSDDQNYIEISKAIAKDISSKNFTILEVIEKLAYLLLNKSHEKRDIGVLILSETLNDLPSATLDSQQLLVLSNYFCEKLNDHHQVARSALKGVLALIKFSNIPSESVVNLITCIFNQVTCQQQQPQDRYVIFQIFETVLKDHINEVNLMGIDFVYGVISSIDGERNPKNLIYLFDWMQTFLKIVKLGHLTEEMFEVLSCYFPVDFKPSISDKNNITREDLAEGLCKCLTSIAEFGQYAIPVTLEKLDSSLKIAKEDSLDVLKIGCKTYQTETYNQFSIEIWSQIQKEIFNTSDDDFKHKCLETLKEIIHKLSLGDQKNFENSVLDITDTLKGNVLPDSKLFSQSSDILIYVARASEVSARLVAKKVLPLLENTFKITNNPKHKSVILHTIIEFVKAVIETNPKVDFSSFEEIAEVPSLCLQATSDQDDHIIIEGYQGLTEILQYLPKNLSNIYSDMLRQALTVNMGQVKPVLKESLRKMAKICPQEVEELILSIGKPFDNVCVDNYLDSLDALIEFAQFEEYIIETYIHYSTANVGSCAIALRHLSDNSTGRLDHINQGLMQKNFIETLVHFLAQINNDELLQKDFLKAINEFLVNSLKNEKKQKAIYLAESNKKFCNKNIYATVLSGLIIPLQRETFEDYDKIDFLMDCSLNSAEEFVREISMEVIGNILNKIDDDSILQDKLNKIKNFCGSVNEHDAKIWLASWVTKGLMTRNHPKALEWTDMILNSIKNNNVEAAMGLGLVMKECSVISPKYYCKIMPLYQQKFFEYCTTELNQVSDTHNEAFLNAVAYLFEHAPISSKQATVLKSNKGLRLFFLCLEKCTNSSLLERLLEKILLLIACHESFVEDHLETILLRILDLTKFEPSMEVRIKALTCLRLVTTKCKLYKLLPLKNKVIQELAICVDDKKRFVRRVAMECRSLWYLLDAPI